MVSNTSNYRAEFDGSYGALGATNVKNDLKLKISKLEAYSRQLCLNLIDLQKNREDITNKTFALSEELDHSRNHVNDAFSETDICVLLRAKSGCCAICKGYEGWEAASLEESALEETIDLPEPAKVPAFDEPDSSACSCCVCCENRISHDCDGCNSLETISRADSLTNSFTLSYRLAGNIGMPYNGGSYRICKCERDGDEEERFRGGMDCAEATPYYIDHDCTCIVEIERNGQTRESCASCCTRNLCDSLSAWPSWDTESKCVDQLAITSVTNREDLQTLGLDDDRAELEQNSTPAAFPETPNDKTTSTATLEISNNESAPLQCRIEDDCEAKSNVFDPPDLLRYLETIAEMSRRVKEDKTNIEDKNCTKDLLTGLSVLFLVVLAFLSRYSTFNSLSHYPNSFSTYVLRIFERIAEFITITNFRTCVNFAAKLSTFFGAAFVTMYLAKSTLSLVARLHSSPQKLFVFSTHCLLGNFYKSIKRFARRTFFCATSQYHLFSYFSCLVLGFLMGKVSRIYDKWFLGSSRISSDNEVVNSDIETNLL